VGGLLHVSDMSWVRKVGHPSEVLNKGDAVGQLINMSESKTGDKAQK
jgi:small subunit ribosomal protein S1